MQRVRRAALIRRRSPGGIAMIAGWIGVRIKVWRTRRALLALNDEQLKDLGLSRSEGYSETLRNYRD